MPEPRFDADYEDVADVADDIIASVASQNGGVVEVVPADAVERQLAAALENDDEFEGDDWEDLLVRTKDAVLARDVMIA